MSLTKTTISEKRAILSLSSEECTGKLNGLCLSFHHLDQTTVGSRRFRSLVPIFRNRGFNIDLIAYQVSGANTDSDLFEVKSFSPYISSLNWLWRQKSKINTGSSFFTVKSRVPLDSNKFLKTSKIKHNGIRSLILSVEQLPDLHSGLIIPVIWKALWRRHKYDFVISTAPPWSSHIAAIIIGRLLKVPVILDDRDPWVGNLFRLNFITHPVIRRIDKYLANASYSRANGIVCVTNPACKLHVEQLHDNSIPVRYIPHGYDPVLERYYSEPKQNNKLTITHVGSTYHGRSAKIITEAAETLDENMAKDFHFQFIGEISQSEINTMEKKFKVTFHGFQKHDYCVREINGSDICLLMAIGQPAQIPSKLYEYIGLGRPVLAISDKDDSTMMLLKDKEWAWTVATNDKMGLIQVLKDIHKRWKNNCLPALKLEEREEFSFERIADGYVKFIREIVQKTKRDKA